MAAGDPSAIPTTWSGHVDGHVHCVVERSDEGIGKQADRRAKNTDDVHLVVSDKNDDRADMSSSILTLANRQAQCDAEHEQRFKKETCMASRSRAE